MEGWKGLGGGGCNVKKENEGKRMPERGEGEEWGREMEKEEGREQIGGRGKGESEWERGMEEGEGGEL